MKPDTNRVQRFRATGLAVDDVKCVLDVCAERTQCVA
jgi:hypothetical protein